MKSLLILQNEIMEYRKPVYNGLAEHYDVTVFHSGLPSVTVKDTYYEVIAPYKRIGPFFIQPHSSLRERLDRSDVVIAMFDLRWPSYLLPLLRDQRPKYILWGQRYSRNSLANAVRDRLINMADRLLMYGDEEVEQMITRGVDPHKFVLAPNTIHVANHADYSDAPKSSLLFVGRLQTRKRVDLLIETFAHLLGRIGEGVRLDIVGDGEMQNDLKQLAAKHHLLHKVVFHGRIDDPEILARIFSQAYAYVSPSPVGLGVLHSLAYGVPVITLRNVRHGPEFHNLVDGKNAIICEDMDEIEKAMEKVCTDQTFSTELGRNAYQRYVGERTLVKMLEGFRKAIDE
ncbi:MAG: glycosyltransferase family 4 protein [Nitrospira sp.]|nr:MAG: glycosyltransferase family 4 protein [Nitrospira sp.]